MTDTLEIAKKCGAFVDEYAGNEKSAPAISFWIDELEAFRAEIERRIVPEGWRVVPNNPTEHMNQAAAVADAMCCHDDLTLDNHLNNFGIIYTAMLAAAPSPKE